jgi:Tetratricopeptide repeat
LDNLRAAVRWLWESGKTETYLLLAGALWRFCYLRGLYEEGYRWLERALTGAAPAASRAKALLGAGVLALLRCEYDRVERHLEEALALYRGLGDGEGVASALQVLGSVARERADYVRAEELHGESLALWRGLGDGAGEAHSLNYLGFVAWLRGEHQRAREICEETLVTFRGLGDSEGVVWALISLGASAQYAGSLGRARTILDESLALSGEVGYSEGVGWALNQLAASSRSVRATPDGHGNCCKGAWRCAGISATAGAPRAYWRGWRRPSAPKDATSARRAFWARRTPSVRPSAPPCRPANEPGANAPKAPSADVWATPNSRGCGPKAGLWLSKKPSPGRSNRTLPR